MTWEKLAAFLDSLFEGRSDRQPFTEQDLTLDVIEEGMPQSHEQYLEDVGDCMRAEGVSKASELHGGEHEDTY